MTHGEWLTLGEIGAFLFSLIGIWLMTKNNIFAPIGGLLLIVSASVMVYWPIIYGPVSYNWWYGLR